MTQQTETLIIGAGPAGLAMAGRLRKANLPFEIIEQSGELATSWKHHYDRVHLHTVKQFSHLPFLPFPKEYPRYVPRKLFVAYLEDYARHFDIKPTLNQQAQHIGREGHSWRVATKEGEIWKADRVILCTGVNHKPFIPPLAGSEGFRGSIIHSKFYQNPAPYQGKKVLVVGMGNTGAEVALDLCEQGVEVALSVRGPVNIIMRDTLGRPVQLTSMLLSKLPTPLGDAIGRFLGKLTVGDLSPYGLHRPDMAPSRQLRTLGKTPVIDVGTISRIKKGEIMVFSGIEKISENEVVFTDGKTAHFDAIILATGYAPQLTGLVEGIGPALNAQATPKSLWVEEVPNLYFLGFDVYSSGILHGINKDSGLIADHIQQHLK
ncbi:MAG: NAD(P)/FAD-dependent oxidoreductase [Bacteroidia bacterium]|nr:NAD(P)/FAD-dependent oxidoreductase [Bacteroidia bacterium]